MKTTLLLVCMSLLVCLGCKEGNKVNPPEVVVTKFNSLYPNATKVKWEMEDNQYEASFLQDTVEKSVVFDAEGQVQFMESAIAAATLPQPIRDYVAQQLGGKPIDEATMIIFADGDHKYEAEVEKKDYIFNAAGQFVSVEEEKNDD